jgi:hypothetical protein
MADLKEVEGIREQAQAIIESNVTYYRLRAFKGDIDNNMV